MRRPKYLKVELTYDEKKKPRAKVSLASWLEEFFKTAVGGALLSLLFTTIVGGMIGLLFNEAQEKAARKSEIAKVSISSRDELMRNVSDTLMNRRIYVGLVASGIERGIPKEELLERWKNYQASYVQYNKSYFALKSSANIYLGDETYDIINNYFEENIGFRFGRVDNCLTNYYYSSLFKTDSHARVGKIKLGVCKFDSPKSEGSRFEYVEFREEVRKLKACLSTFQNGMIYLISAEDKYDRLPENEIRRFNANVRYIMSDRYSVDYFRRVSSGGDILPMRETYTIGSGDVDIKCPADKSDVPCERYRARQQFAKNLDKDCEPPNLPR